MDEPSAGAAVVIIENPRPLHVADLHAESWARLLERSRELQMRVNPDRARHQIIFDLLRHYAAGGTVVLGKGIVDIASEQHAFLRWPGQNFRPGPEDPYLSSSLLKRYGIQNGNLLLTKLRAPRDREKFMTVEEVLEIEGGPAEAWALPKNFEQLTPMFPDQRIILENDVTKSLSARAVDLITPLGRGQRALIVAPPRTGKTVLLKEIAQAIRVSSPETHLILLLVDERPEEVTDLRRSVDADIFSSTFDESPSRHVQVAELVSDRAKRLVEIKQHVVILLDSITRLARGYNSLMPAKGRTMSGGVDAQALAKPKKFFSSARNVEEGGSLTIIATALVETESRMDEVIFEEFKGTGNMELHLDRELVERRIFPAIQILKSGTRREELLYHPDEFERIKILRRQLAELPSVEATELLVQNLRATKTNAELVLAGLRG
ncbi:MAG: transcription termination factor Rho [Chthoniobacter sp.]|jgi:transcription termination factor Rho|nr:transcription termination factor Rho [Chthoniobacter sp.]